MLHLPETAHLYALLNCAQFNQKHYLEPEIESYLIQTMMRYAEMVEMDEYYEMDEALECEDINADLEHDYLKEIADYCLICTGLMGDQFQFEETSFERLQEVGQTAFTMLSDHLSMEDNIYKKLSLNFSRLVEILNYSQSLIEDGLNSNSHLSMFSKDSFYIGQDNRPTENILYH